MTTIHDIAALCAAIDDGDDSALPILADALEEAGDPRAGGLRKCPPLFRWDMDGMFGWWYLPFLVENYPEDRFGWSEHSVTAEQAEALRLAGHPPYQATTGETTCVRCWRTYSAAYLALAEVLAHA